MKDNKNSNLLPEYVWMIFVGMLLAILVLMHVFPAKAWTASNDSVIVFDYKNMRFVKGTSDNDGNVFHPGVSNFLALEESYNGFKWLPLPVNNYLNNFDTSGLVSCVLAPPSLWADEDHYSYHYIGASPFAIQTLSIPEVPDDYRISDLDSGVYFEGGDGLIYAAFSDSSIYLKNKDQRGVSGVYYMLPYLTSTVYVYQWVGSWTYLGSSTYSDSSLTDSIAISTLFKGSFEWGDFEYNYAFELYTDNYGLYNGVLPRLDIFSSYFNGSSDIPVDPEPEPDVVSFQFYARPYYSSGVFSSYGYYLVDILGTDFNKEVTAPPSNALNYAVSHYSVSNPWTNFVFFPYLSNSSGTLGVYFSGNVSSVRVYFTGDNHFSSDTVRSNYSYSEYSYEGSDLNIGSNMRLFFDSSTGLFFWGFLHSFDAFGFSGFFNIDVPKYKLTDIRISATSFNKSFYFNQSSSDQYNYLSIAYGFGLSSEVFPTSMITPSPSPTVTPEPTPSATPIPTPGNTVIIVTPVIPTPTPFLNVDIPSSPGSDLDGDTTDGILSTGFNFISNGGSSGLLSTAFSFIPDELQYLIWFLIFLLILLATLKIILHFGG